MAANLVRRNAKAPNPNIRIAIHNNMGSVGSPARAILLIARKAIAIRITVRTKKAATTITVARWRRRSSLSVLSGIWPWLVTSTAWLQLNLEQALVWTCPASLCAAGMSRALDPRAQLAGYGREPFAAPAPAEFR